VTAARRDVARRVRLGTLAALAALAGAATLVGGCGRGGAPSFKATDITGADYGRTLALTDHRGQPRTLADWKGKVVVLFFGFTQCPDVCPTTLATLADVMKRLGPDADRVQVLFVTLDPERDTPAVIAPYVTAFDPRFVGLYGDRDQTEKVQGSTAGTYTIDHTAASYAIDRDGRLRLYIRHAQSAEDVAADLRRLISG
jgi:protein SCO1/2